MSGEGLRFVPDLSLRGYGAYGVNLFFVLSAFLLTRRFLERPPSSPGSLPYWLSYAARRVARIYPLYLVVLLAATASPFLSEAVAGPAPFSFFRHALLLDGHKILWTIPVEMKFYATLPFLLLGLHWSSRRRLAGGVFFLVALLAVVAWLLPVSEASSPIALQKSLPLFLAGMLAATCSPTESRPRSSTVAGLLWDLMAGLTLLGILAPWTLGTPLGGSHRLVQALFGGDGPWFGFAWALFVCAAVRSRGPLRWLLERKSMRVFGVVSFSAYLWHMPVINFVARDLMAASPAPLQALVGLCGIAALAVASFLVVEKPFMDLAARWSAPGRRSAAGAGRSSPSCSMASGSAPDSR